MRNLIHTRTPGPSGSNRPGAVFWAALAVSSLFYLVFILRCGFMAGGETWFSLFDDAMISMRYARNLALGHGLVWNPGEVPVEGYTNLLWTLWLALLHLLPVSLSKISLLVMISGAFILLFNLGVVKALAEDISGQDPWVAGPVLVLTGLCYPLVFWTLRGMEVGLLTLLVDLGLLLALRLIWDPGPRLLAGLAGVLALAVVVRVDALIPGAVIAGYVWVRLRGPWRRRSFLVLGSALVLILAAKSLFSLGLYGQALPNTYYLKVEGASLAQRLSRGWVNLWLQVRTSLFPILVPLAVFAIPYVRRRLVKNLPTLLLPLALFGGQAAYSVYVGGDAWEWWMLYASRYLCPALPALILAACQVTVKTARSWSDAPPTKTRTWLLALLLCLGAAAAAWGIHILARRSPEPFPPYGLYSRQAFITGTALISAGLLALVMGWLVNVPSGKAKTAPAWAVLGLAWVSLNLVGLLPWVTQNAHHVRDDALMTRLGLFVRQGTEPQARVAMAWAGALPYFSDRPAVDLLGKNDPVIARMKPVAPFLPGHNKWDLGHSVGQLRPDLVITFGWAFKPRELAYLREQGYEELSPGFHVHRDSRLVKRETIRRDWRDPEILEAVIRGR